MDFFVNKCGRYCPPAREMTALFAKEVLEGSKFLLKFSQVKPIENVPQFKVNIFLLFTHVNKEFSSKRIWASVKNKNNAQDILKYFPDYQGDILPNKGYLLNILNTLEPGLIAKTVKDL